MLTINPENIMTKPSTDELKYCLDFTNYFKIQIPTPSKNSIDVKEIDIFVTLIDHLK